MVRSIQHGRLKNSVANSPSYYSLHLLIIQHPVHSVNYTRQHIYLCVSPLPSSVDPRYATCSALLIISPCSNIPWSSTPRDPYSAFAVQIFLRFSSEVPLQVFRFPSKSPLVSAQITASTPGSLGAPSRSVKTSIMKMNTYGFDTNLWCWTTLYLYTFLGKFTPISATN